MLLFGTRSPSVQVLGGSRCAGRCAELLARETLAQTELYYIVVNMVQHTAQPLAASPMPANYCQLEELFFCKRHHKFPKHPSVWISCGSVQQKGVYIMTTKC